MRWDVEVTETVTFRTTVDAETIEEARIAALDLHEEGLTSECDSSAGEVSWVRLATVGACGSCGAIEGTEAFDDWHDSVNCWAGYQSAEAVAQ